MYRYSSERESIMVSFTYKGKTETQDRFTRGDLQGLWLAAVLCDSLGTALIVDTGA